MPSVDRNCVCMSVPYGLVIYKEPETTCQTATRRKSEGRNDAVVIVAVNSNLSI